MKLSDQKELLRLSLKNSNRFAHSLGVEKTAVDLARRFGVSEEKARIAGLLHDCAREFPNDQLISEAQKRGIEIDEVEFATPLLLHAPIGARLIREKYEVDDEEISQAISRHTVAARNMSDLDKIIYFADMIEPNRNYPEVDHLRELSRTVSLDEMFLTGLSESILFIVAKNALIHPATVESRNQMLFER